MDCLISLLHIDVHAVLVVVIVKAGRLSCLTSQGLYFKHYRMYGTDWQEGSRWRSAQFSYRIETMMTYPSLVLAFLLLRWGTLGSDNHCLVSKGFRSQVYEISYPIYMLEKSHITSRTEYFNCSTAGSGDRIRESNHTQCLTNSGVACPVSAENIKAALRPAAWLQYVEAFRRIVQAQKQKRPHFANVYFLGGSMPCGSDTNCWCTCTSEFDSRCPVLLPKSCLPVRCSWITHISTWLQRTYPATVFAIHDFTHSGRSTMRSVGVFGDLLLDSGANLTSNDIVFMDHSVNDAQGSSDALELNMERLVRTILLTSARHFSARPTIVTIEQYAHKSNHYTDKMPQPDTDTRDYAHIYRKVSEHYQVVLLSMREVYWTYYGPPHNRNFTEPSNLATRQYPFSPFQRDIHGRAHVPYFMHTFIADTFASIISHTAKRLDLEEATGINSTIEHPHAIRILPPTTSIELPKSLNHLSGASSACDTMSPYLLQAEPNTTFQPENVTLFEGDKVGAAVGWRQYVDFHNVAGWMINDLSSKHRRSLIFPLGSASPSYKGLILKVEYLHSYEGMGRLQVYLCGRLVVWPDSDKEGFLDGLRSDDQVSIPFEARHEFGKNDDKRCRAASARDRVVQLVYSPGGKDKALRAVHRNKFKLLGVTVCRPLHL